MIAQLPQVAFLWWVWFYDLQDKSQLSDIETESGANIPPPASGIDENSGTNTLYKSPKCNDKPTVGVKVTYGF